MLDIMQPETLAAFNSNWDLNWTVPIRSRASVFCGSSTI